MSQNIDINNQLVEQLLSKADSSELFGRNGLFQHLKKQIVEKILASELDHELRYSKHSKVEIITVVMAAMRRR